MVYQVVCGHYGRLMVLYYSIEERLMVWWSSHWSIPSIVALIVGLGFHHITTSLFSYWHPCPNRNRTRVLASSKRTRKHTRSLLVDRQRAIECIFIVQYNKLFRFRGKNCSTKSEEQVWNKSAMNFEMISLGVCYCARPQSAKCVRWVEKFEKKFKIKAEETANILSTRFMQCIRCRLCRVLHWKKKGHWLAWPGRRKRSK